MKQLKNKKGMTLIEIVVVLLMMSILLVVVGSLILNSFNYFDKTSNQDASKRTLDSVSDFVRSELLYASDVRVAQVKPDEEDWKVFYVKDKRLYHNDQALYSEGFYNRKNLEMKIRGYDSYRLDINYALFDSENEKTYSTKDTLELLNLKITAEADKTFNPFANISTKVTISEINKIYYKEGMKPIEDDPQPEDPTKGTVADQIGCMTDENNKGKFVNDKRYEVGDFVFIIIDNKEVYFRCLVAGSFTNENEVTGQTRLAWKRIEAQHNPQSGYVTGDVVVNGEKFYKCIQNIIGSGIGMTIQVTNTTYWKEISKPIESNKLCYLPGTVVPGTVAYKPTVDKLIISEVEEWKEHGHGNLGYVKLNNVIWKRLINGYGGLAPGNKDPDDNVYVWQKIQIDWDRTSAYTSWDQETYQDAPVGDIVRFAKNSGGNDLFYRVKGDVKDKKPVFILDGSQPAYRLNEKWVTEKRWERVQLDANDEWVVVEE